MFLSLVYTQYPILFFKMLTNEFKIKSWNVICNVPQLSSEFQTQIQPQKPGRFSNPSQRRVPIGRFKKIQEDIEYPFEHGEVINYTLDVVSIHPGTTKIQASFLTQLPERKETAQGFHHEANGDFKTVTEFNGCDGGKRRFDQQHCISSTILT